MDYPLDCYKDDPKSIGAAVETACNSLGLFRDSAGLFDRPAVQRSDLLTLAQQQHARANDGKTCPEHETLGRELRHRNERMVNGTNRQRMHFADRALAQGWRIFCDKGRVWAERV